MSILFKERRFGVILALILLFSLIVRLASVGHGLPHLQVTDENSDLSTAIRLMNGEIPGWHVRYHRSLIAYVDAAASAGLFGYSFLTGQVDGIQAFQNLYFSDRHLFTLATRLLMALLTTGAILLAALAGRFINRGVGLLAAAILAVNAFFTLNANFAMPDALVMVFIALFLYLVMRLWKYHRNRDYFLAGVALALVMLSKFSGVPVAAALVVAHLAVTWEAAQQGTQGFVRRLLFAPQNLWFILGVVLGNVLFNPLPFFYPADLIREFDNLRNHAYGVNAPRDRLPVILSRVADAARLVWRWLLPASLLAVIAGIRYYRFPPYWIITSSFAALFLTIANVTSTHYKIFFWTPWIVPLALFSAVGLDSLRQWAIRRRVPWLAYGVIGLILALETAFLFTVLTRFAAPNTRLAAFNYIQANFPPDSRIMSGEPLVFAVPLQRSQESIERAYSLDAPGLASWDWWLSQPADQRPGIPYNLYGPEMQEVIDTFEDVERLIEAEHIQYVIEMDFCAGTQNRPDATSDEEYPAISPEIRATWNLLAVFSPYGTDTCLAPIEFRTGLTWDNLTALEQQVYPGPLLRIYEVPPPTP